ncbi:MAG: carboxypeptidase regulatory-like domain-containing protein [Lysobacterales bacterium]
MNTQAVALLFGLTMTGLAPNTPPPLPSTATTLNEGYEVSWNPNPASDDFFPSSKAFAAALALDRTGASSPGNPRGHHEGFANFLFASPYFSEQPKSLDIYDCKEPDGNGGCDNGFATLSRILLPTSVYADESDSCINMIVGHELFHHVEFAYAELIGGSGCGSLWGNTVCEGQARAMQDKVYNLLDLLPSASCTAPYLGQVNNYLGDTNQSLWLASYDAALWWTYLTEQYGINEQEPGLGVDFLTLWWGQAVAAGLQGADAMSITDSTIKLFDESHSLYSAFQNFTIANLVKDFDLSNASSGFVNRYSYRDEDPVGGFNMMNYNDVTIDFDLGTIGQGQEVTQLVGVQYFGARYLKADISSCPANKIIQLEIDAADTTTSGADAVASYGVVINRNDRPREFYKKYDVDWTLTTFQRSNRFDELYLVIAPVAGFWIGNVTLSCQSPQSTFDVDFPLAGESRPHYGGSASNPGTIAVSVVPTSTGIDGRKTVSGLSALQFDASIGDQPAQVLQAVPDGDGYLLQLLVPPQAADGAYPLEIRAGEAVQTIDNAVAYIDTPPTEVILAIDTSSTMAFPPDGSKLAAVTDAGLHLLQQLDSVLAAGLVDFSGDGTEPNDDGRTLAPLAAADATHRNRIRVALNGLSADAGRTSAIGDGLRTAYQMFLSDGEPLRAQHTVLVVDGPENEEDLWRDIRDTIVASGMIVHTVALGPLADQALLAEIARATGGEFRYADVQPLFTEVLDLHAALGQIADVIEGRTQIQREQLALDVGNVISLDIPIRENTSAPAVIGVRSARSLFTPPSIQSVRLFRPDGSEVLARDLDVARSDEGNAVSFIGALVKGTWRLEVTAATAANNQQAEVAVSIPDANGLNAQTGFFLPEVDDDVVLGFVVGQPIGVGFSVADSQGLQPLRSLIATIEMPNGDTQVINVPVDSEETGQTESLRVEEGSGSRSINFSFLSNSGSATGLPDDGSSGQRGTYQVQLDAELADGRKLIAHEVTHVVQQTTPPDRDGDQLPDSYEDRYSCLDGDVNDATVDGDDDMLSNFFEFTRGTRPCLTDTDGGGEMDGSEVRGGRNPLDPTDDALPMPLGGHVVTQRTEHEEQALLTDNAVTVKLPAYGRFDNLTLKRGLTEDSLLPLTTFDSGAHQTQEYVDRRVDIGQEYFYQFQGEMADGSLSAPGRIFSGFALADANAPLGSVSIADYHLRTDGNSAVVENALYNEDPATAEFRARLDQDRFGPWMPYVSQWTVNFDGVSVPTIRTVTVQYRDPSGNVSIRYVDDITQWPAGTLGRITGRITLSGNEGLTNILVSVKDDPLQKPALTDDSGNYVLSGLEPGNYALEFTRMDYAPMTVPGLDVDAGQDTNVADQQLVPEGEFVFSDGFE